MNSSQDLKKQAAAEKAMDYVENGMTIGMGSGSTVYWAIRKMAEKVQEGWKLQGIPTSQQTEKWAVEFGIPLTSFRDVEELDLAIDGADELDDHLVLIKGGGGALLREKMIAATSRKLIIVADDTKWVSSLGKYPLPVEVIPFGWEATARKISRLGCSPQLRMEKDSVFVTDNGNYILDCPFGAIPDPHHLNIQLHLIPGVAETGLFIGMADTVLLGGEDEVKILTRKP